MKKYFGFTLVEALMVMILLGIIAAVMISIIKPGKFKEQALKAVAKDVHRGIENALDIVSVNYSPRSNFTKLYSPDKSILSDDISNQKHAYYLADEMKDYLSLSRENKACGSGDTDLFNYCYDEVDGMKNAYYLKKGSWIKIKYKAAYTNTATPMAKSLKGMKGSNIYILFDVNGNKKPNILGQDRFVIPLFNGDNALRNYTSEHRCSVGQFWFDTAKANGNCTSCSAGFYCPDGYSIYECPEGLTSTFGAKTISECNIESPCQRGEYYENEKCEICPIGKYCDGKRIADLIGYSKYTNSKEGGGAASLMDLTEKLDFTCAPGEIIDNTNVKCLPCLEGRYCPNSDGFMISCPANHYCPTGTISPIPCPTGKTSPTLSTSETNCR